MFVRRILLMLMLSPVLAAANGVDCELVRAHLRPGDIVLIGLDSAFFKKVARTTNSWVSHVGLAIHDSKRGWLIYESAIPVARATPLCDYVGRAAPGELAIRRLPSLAESDLPFLVREAQARLGVLYHQGFDYDSRRQFCSKFVHDVFLNGLAHSGKLAKIGEIQTFREVFEHARAVLPPALFEELHSFWSNWFIPIGGIPMDRRTVTPHSQYIDADLDTVMDLSTN